MTNTEQGAADPVRSASELISLPIVTRADARRLGRVQDLLFEPSEHALYGYLVATEGDDVLFLRSSNVQSIGAGAIIVENESALTPSQSDVHACELIDCGIHLMGTGVFNERGDSLGKVTKILLRPDGSVSAYEAASGMLGFGEKTQLQPSDVMTIGPDAVIVHELLGRPRAQTDGATEQHDSGLVETLPDGSLSIPILEEEIIVTKRIVVRERLIVRRDSVVERRPIGIELREERMQVVPDEHAPAADTVMADRGASHPGASDAAPGTAGASPSPSNVAADVTGAPGSSDV